jgi:cytochrome c-type biogenesis protein CcsB
MSAISDTLLVVTVLAYLTAMICYAAQYAFGDRGPVARAAVRPVRRAAMAGAPASTDDTGGTGTGWVGADADGSAVTADDAGPTRRARLLGQAAMAALLFAVAVHLATLVTRGIAAERMPWGNMYEFILATTFVGVAVWLGVLFRYPSVRHLGLYVSLANVILLGLAGMAVYTPVEPLVPALDSAWFIIHVAAAALASGIFLVGFVTAVMYLIRAGYDRGSRRFPYPLGAKVPSAVAVERLTFRLTAFAFPIWTFAVIAGAIWAEASWGRYWAWDPKEVWAFISWVVYAGYLHARATPSVKRTVAAWLAIIGFLTIMMNLFGVNLFFESLHSYA